MSRNFVNPFLIKFFISILGCNPVQNKTYVIDWSQFVPTLIATFIAFCLTLFASYLYDRYKDSVQKRNFIHDICRELDAMQTDIRSI